MEEQQAHSFAPRLLVGCANTWLEAWEPAQVSVRVPGEGRTRGAKATPSPPEGQLSTGVGKPWPMGQILSAPCSPVQPGS